MIVAQRGMVATSNPLATQAGLNILRAGGNAADAAIAVAAVLNVTEPASTGIGGDCFALYYEAKTGEVTALNGSGRAPAALDAAQLRGMGYTQMPERSPHSVTVPGAAAGWEDLLKRHGRMTLREVLKDAIHYALHGYPVHTLFAAAWGRSESFLRNSSHTEDYLPAGRAPRVGESVRLPGLARTLQAVAEGGAEAFYLGDVGKAIVTTLQSLGGMMTEADLRDHRSTWQNPISTEYGGVTVLECPPNGQGLAALLAMNIASEWAVGAMPFDSAERVHSMVEAMRLGFADAFQYVADAETNPAPLAGLLSKTYAARRREMIRPAQAMRDVHFGMPPVGNDTVYLSVVDGDGNACSFINSLYMGWGSGIVAKGTGVFLQNRGAGFVLTDGHPNCLAPGKRPYHTIIPALALREGKLWSSFGVMGGFMQPQGHLQVLSALVDDGLNPQEALDRPRWCIEHTPTGYTLALEEGIPIETMARLAEWGHPIRPVSGAGRGVFGDGQIICRDGETGVLLGGSDPRKDGQTAGF
jgi:gamma-glutamyltranspeptidase/glutathione hydrolase